MISSHLHMAKQATFDRVILCTGRVDDSSSHVNLLASITEMTLLDKHQVKFFTAFISCWRLCSALCSVLRLACSTRSAAGLNSRMHVKVTDACVSATNSNSSA
jgi:hypothetical protein